MAAHERGQKYTYSCVQDEAAITKRASPICGTAARTRQCAGTEAAPRVNRRPSEDTTLIASTCTSTAWGSIAYPTWNRNTMQPDHPESITLRVLLAMTVISITFGTYPFNHFAWVVEPPQSVDQYYSDRAKPPGTFYSSLAMLVIRELDGDMERATMEMLVDFILPLGPAFVDHQYQAEEGGRRNADGIFLQLSGARMHPLTWETVRFTMEWIVKYSEHYRPRPWMKPLGVPSNLANPLVATAGSKEEPGMYPGDFLVHTLDEDVKIKVEQDEAVPFRRTYNEGWDAYLSLNQDAGARAIRGTKPSRAPKARKATSRKAKQFDPTQTRLDAWPSSTAKPISPPEPWPLSTSKKWRLTPFCLPLSLRHLILHRPPWTPRAPGAPNTDTDDNGDDDEWDSEDDIDDASSDVSCASDTSSILILSWNQATNRLPGQFFMVDHIAKPAAYTSVVILAEAVSSTHNPATCRVAIQKMMSM
ncbi:hypothetical protein MAPG_04709 [Magnaporthiopsis poae ATCC 64411]|uniref:Uncharacterized protein n=1 Tax=Magnaporthiopsis poae (strain ATCC 64411 / 73-15) TaxID=644358 RepID=A0A0C4DXF6_MAGP6|nr:hypothetical protein MAPG_04709 [Magnaporthiopsis poae ATCC 64411]